MNVIDTILQFLFWALSLTVLPLVAARFLENYLNAGKPDRVENIISMKSVMVAWMAALYPLLPGALALLSIFVERFALGHWQQDFEPGSKSVIATLAGYAMAATMVCVPTVLVFAIAFAYRLNWRFGNFSYFGVVAAGFGSFIICLACIMILPD